MNSGERQGLELSLAAVMEGRDVRISELGDVGASSWRPDTQQGRQHREGRGRGFSLGHVILRTQERSLAELRAGGPEG